MGKKVQIRRPLFWLQKALDVFGQKTSLPSEVNEEIVPSLDSFGWERLGEAEQVSRSGAAPAQHTSFINGNNVTLVLHASVHHTDTGVTHNPMISVRKSDVTSGFGVGVGVDRAANVVDERASLIRPVVLMPGDILFGRLSTATVAGAVQLTMWNIDLGAAAGEYVPYA